MLTLVKCLIIFVLLIGSSKLWAYPQSIGYSHQSCISCHYNPFGNGPLTDYGRALSATTTSDRKFRNAKFNEEELGENSGFLYSPPSNTWFRPSLNYRSFYLEEESQKKINMHTSANVVLKNKADSFLIVSSLTHIPPQTKPKVEGQQSHWRSREHYLAFRQETWGFYIGMMDKVFGIRTEDLQSFSRTRTNNGQEDQVHGIVIHQHRPDHDFGLHLFAGNMDQNSIIRQSGASSTYEHNLNSWARLGGSILFSSNDYNSTNAYAIHTRLGFGRGSSILSEIGQVTKKNKKVNISSNTSRYFLMKNQIAIRRGFFFIYCAEWLKDDDFKSSKTLRLKPGLQYFISQGVDFRLDLYNTRVVSDTSATEDSWATAGQLHIWF